MGVYPSKYQSCGILISGQCSCSRKEHLNGANGRISRNDFLLSEFCLMLAPNGKA
jgi:hypothetical protein